MFLLYHRLQIQITQIIIWLSFLQSPMNNNNNNNNNNKKKNNNNNKKKKKKKKKKGDGVLKRLSVT